MRHVRLIILAVLAVAACDAQTIVLDSFNAGSTTGAIIAGTSWTGNVTQNSTSITIGGSATDINGWGAKGITVDATGMRFLTVTAQREAGNTAAKFTIQLEDAGLNTRVISVNASAFAVGVPTQVQIPISSSSDGFLDSQIASWSLGGGGVGLQAFRLTLDSVSLDAAPIAGTTLAPSGTTTYSGQISGTNGLTINGPGTLILGAANTFSGTVTLTQGTLKLGAVGAIPSTAPVNLATGATLDLNGKATTIAKLEGTGGTVALTGASLTVAQSTNSTFSGALSGTGGLTKTGAGTLTLAGTQTFSGATSITGGQIKLNGSAASSPFTVGSGGTLSGTGAVGALTISSGGTLAPGNSPGTTTVTGNSTFDAGGSYVWEINNAAGAAGTNYDLLSISGHLTITATSASPFAINITSLLGDNSAGNVINFNSATTTSYTIATASGGIIDFSAAKFAISTANFSNPLNGGTWSVSASGNDLNLIFTAASAIPEPSTYAALLGAATLALAACSRRLRGSK